MRENKSQKLNIYFICSFQVYRIVTLFRFVNSLFISNLLDDTH